MGASNRNTGPASPGLDFDRIRKEHDLNAVVQSYGVALTPGSGGRHFARCPFHDDKHASFSTYVDPVGVQRWGCFACGDEKKGDVIDFVAEQHGVDTGEAARILTGEAKNTQRPALKPRPAPERAAPVESWRQIVPVPVDAGPLPEGPGDFRHREHGTPAVIWTYRDAQGGLVGYVCRFNKPDGSKVILPFSYGLDGQKPAAWDFKAFNDPRPLYGLQNLAANPSAQVLVVEGEKTADAAQRLFPTISVVTWPGGSSAVAKADWSALQGRKVCIWPDADSQRYGANDERAGQTKPLDGQPGTKAALKIAAMLKAGLTDYVRVVRLPDPATDPSAPGDGWDLADGEAEGWTSQTAVDFLKAHLAEPWEQKADPPQRKPRQAEPTPNAEPKPEPARESKTTPTAAAVNDNAPQHGEDYGQPEHTDEGNGEDYAGFSDADYSPPPIPDECDPFAWKFRCLGHLAGVYYFLPCDSGDIIGLTPGGMTKNALFQLAPSDWWELNFPGAKGGANWTTAVDAIIQKSKRVGFYDPLRVRGRGAWIDRGRAIVHVGNRLVVDGVETAIHALESSYIYEAGTVAEFKFSAPATSKEAHQLVDLCEMLSWERPIYGKLLAGWCAVAHICGALRWRPHIWITGASGSGKSWVYDSILRKCLDGYALACQSNTTEAGLRQALGNDALPVIFDEAESENQRGKERIRNVLELMRQASSENGAAILKGSASGQAQQYRIRSVFAFCSIVVAADTKADVSRVSILTLKPYQGADRDERFKLIEATHAGLMTPAFVSRLRARSVSLIPQIRANADTFARAAAITLGSRRYGDQIGALLAGAYSLHNTGEITLDDACRWVEAQEWEEQREAPEDADERRLLLHLLQQPVQVEGREGRICRPNVAEIMTALLKGTEPVWYSLEGGKHALDRVGLRVSGGIPEVQTITISDSHAALKKMLSDTPWTTGWGRLLARIRGAKRKATVKFTGAATRAVIVPVAETPLAEII